MRTTVTLDDELVEKASHWVGIRNKSELVNEALRRMVKQELLDRFLALEGTMPDLKYPDAGVRYDQENISTMGLNDGE